jgi:hypothetical protein
MLVVLVVCGVVLGKELVATELVATTICVLIYIYSSLVVYKDTYSSMWCGAWQGTSTLPSNTQNGRYGACALRICVSAC